MGDHYTGQSNWADDDPFYCGCCGKGIRTNREHPDYPGWCRQCAADDEAKIDAQLEAKRKEMK